MAAEPLPDRAVALFQAAAQQGQKYDVEDSPSNRYYGFLAEIEDIQYDRGGPVTYSVQFELVPFEWMEVAVPDGSGKRRAPPPTSPTTLLVFDAAPLEQVADALGTTASEIGEGQWYIIQLGRDRLTNAKRKAPYSNGHPDPVMAQGSPVKRQKLAELADRYFPLSAWLVDAIRQLFAPMEPREIGVMDVGQGSCNLIYDDQGHTLFYVDVGLPMFFNFASMPSDPAGNVAIINPGPCLGNNPAGPRILGIVTHFHWDHYYMLGHAQNANQLQNRDWIMPAQNAGPLINGIINSINLQPNGRVHVFPQGMGVFAALPVTITQCAAVGAIAAHDLNNSGIAVTVRIDDGQMREALLPGDAAYQCIAGIYGNPNLRWLAATHHGSDRNWQAPPAPHQANQGRLSYSYGINGPVPGGVHAYGHPRAMAVANYPPNWGNPGLVQSTAETGPNSNQPGRGNILMANVVPPPACGVANCPFHAFPKPLV